MAGKTDISKHVQNHMALVFCPKKGAPAYANSTKETRGRRDLPLHPLRRASSQMSENEFKWARLCMVFADIGRMYYHARNVVQRNKPWRPYGS